MKSEYQELLDRLRKADSPRELDRISLELAQSQRLKEADREKLARKLSVMRKNLADRHRCPRRSCSYWNESAYGANSCNYLMVTGKSRIAQIPDRKQRLDFDRCPCYTEKFKRKREKQLLPFETRSHYDWALGTKLYREGRCDREIAEALGCSKEAVKYWRGRMKLPANRRSGE